MFKMKIKNKIYLIILISVLLIGIVYAGFFSKEVSLTKEQKAEIDKLNLTYTPTICQNVGTDNEHCFACLYRARSNQDEGCITIMKKYCSEYNSEIKTECTSYSYYSENEIKILIDEGLKNNVKAIADKIIADKSKPADKIIDEGGVITTKQK